MNLTTRNRYRSGTTTWRYYAAITVDARGWTSGAQYATATIPKDFDDFWDNVGSDPYVRVLNADGATLATYKLTNGSGATFDATAITNRDGQIHISFTPTVAAMWRFVLAWGPTAAVSSAASVFTPSGAYSAYVALTIPSIGYRARLEAAHVTDPTSKLQKGADETHTVGVDLTALLPGRLGRFAGVDGGGAPRYASYDVVDGNGTTVGTMVTASSLRFVGENLITFTVKAGTDGTTYTIKPSVTMSTNDVLTPTCQLSVKTALGS